MSKAITLGEIIAESKSADILAISDRSKIIRYVEQAIEIAEYKAHWNRWVSTIDICSGSDGCITLPSFVDTVLAVNVAGYPSSPRSGWYEFNPNGFGSNNNNAGEVLNYHWDDRGWSPVVQDLKEWSCIAAIVEDPTDGDGTKFVQVFGETMDGQRNMKEAITIPTVGASQSGVNIPMLIGYAAPDTAMTMFRRISRIVKPETRGYVKIIGFGPNQMGQVVTLGYLAPNETNPSYRRIKVSRPCTWCRIRYRRADIPLKYDYDLLPIPSRQAMIDLLRAIRLRESGNIDLAESYETKATQLLSDIQATEDGPGNLQINVMPGFGFGYFDLH